MVVVASLLPAACSDGGADPDGGVVADGVVDGVVDVVVDDVGEDARFPDIVAVDASRDADAGAYRFAVTVSSPYDTPERYADGWRVVGPDGTVYGVHTLAHDHADEQPFTRVQSGVVIPEGVTAVTIEGRDRTNGFGGGTVTVSLEELR